MAKKVRKPVYRKGFFGVSKVPTELDKWISKRPGKEPVYLRALHKLYLMFNRYILTLAYTEQFNWIVENINELGYDRSHRQVWLDLIEMDRREGFSHEWNGKPKPKVTINAFPLEVTEDVLENIKDFLVRRYHEIPFEQNEPNAHNALPYTDKFERIYLELLERDDLPRQPSPNEIFIMLKNLGREPRMRDNGERRRRLGPSH